MSLNFLSKLANFTRIGQNIDFNPQKIVENFDNSIFDLMKEADANGNNTLENSEVTNLCDKLGVNYSELDNLDKLTEEFNKLYTELAEQEEFMIDVPEGDNTSTDDVNGTNNNNNSSNTGNNTNRSSNTNNTNNTNSQTDGNGNTEKSIENMTLEELKTEKENKQKDVDKARENINAIHSGENAAVKNAETNAENAKKAYDEVMEEAVEQEVITEELNERREENLSNISEKESVIDEIKIDINNKEKEIKTTENDISNAKNNLDALKDALASYDKAENKDGEDIAGKKAAIQEQINTEEENIKTLETKKKDLEKEKATQEKNLTTEEDALTELEAEKSEIEQEIMTACQQASPELQAAIQKAMTDFNDSKKNVETVKAQELSAAEAELKTAEAGLKEVNEAYEAKSEKAIEGKHGYRTTEMDSLVNYFGEDYLSVLSQAEIDRIIKLAKLNKMANIYPGKGSACLGICYEYEKWATGLSGKNHAFQSPDLDTAIQQMADVLNSGSPVIAKVNTKAGHRHFVMVIGIKQGATAPYKQSDFLCIDSFDGQVDGMGGSGNRDGNYRTLYMQRGNYWIGTRSRTFG